MPKVPTYERQVSLATPNIQDAPSVPHLDLSGGMSAINKIGEANEKAGETIFKAGQLLAKHAQEQIELRNEQRGAQVYTQYARDMQNKLFNENTEVVKVQVGSRSKLNPDGTISNTAAPTPIYEDVERPVGVMNRSLSQAHGAIDEMDSYYLGNAREQYLSQIPDAKTRQKIAIMMDTHYNTVRGTVISHQASESRKDLVNSFTSSVKQQVADAYGALNPLALTTAVDNAVLTQNELNRAIGADDKSSKMALQATTSDIVENSVMGKLKTTGNPIEATALLDSVKDKLSEQNYSEIKSKIRSSALTIQKQIEHEVLVKQVQTRFDMVNQVATGQLRWDNSGETIKKIALVDKDLAEAMQQVISSDGDYSPKSEVNDEYQKMVNGVFSSSTNEEVSKFLIDAMNLAGNGKISRDRLAILVNAAQNRAKNLPTTSKDSVPQNPMQVAVDAGLKAAMGYYDTKSDKDTRIIDDYLLAIKNNKTPKEAYDIAVKTSIMRNHPEVASHDDVPNIVVTKDSPVKYVFTGNSNIFPARIYNPATKSFEVNTNRAKGTKDKPKE